MQFSSHIICISKSISDFLSTYCSINPQIFEILRSKYLVLPLRNFNFVLIPLLLFIFPRILGEGNIISASDMATNNWYRFPSDILWDEKSRTEYLNLSHGNSLNKHFQDIVPVFWCYV